MRKLGDIPCVGAMAFTRIPQGPRSSGESANQTVDTGLGAEYMAMLW